MQDRFKFRGLAKNNEWYYGSLLWYAGEPQIWEQDGKNYIVKPKTVGQCTGLKDKNGKLIYEGDIVQFGEFYNNEWHSFDIGKVYWGGKYDYPAFELQCSTADFDMCNGLSYVFGEGLSIEVIGNIYENPELLKVENDR